jgi:hypothetical protein
MFDVKNGGDVEMELRVYSLEWFAKQNYPDREDLWPKSIYLGLLKMNPEWAKEYLVNTEQRAMLQELEGGTTEFLAFEVWQHELQDYWRQERDPDGKIDAYIRSRCPEEGTREFTEIKIMGK